MFYATMQTGKKKILSVFVDESGNFGDLDDPSRFCIVALIFHDQVDNISPLIAQLDRANYDLGLDPERFHFHTAPLIRQDGVFAAMQRRMRGRIFDRMMTFVRKARFCYACFSVDTKFVNSMEQACQRITEQIREFVHSHMSLFAAVESVKVYYDAGQKQVSRMLVEGLAKTLTIPTSFAQGARQSDYKMLQVADLICSIHLIELRDQVGLPMTDSERRFFGGLRDFKRRILKLVKSKEIL